MVDAERLHRLLRRLTHDLAWLSRYAEADPEGLLADPVRLGHLKYLFVTAVEAVIDAAHHVDAARGYGPPDTNAQAVLLLGEHGLLEAPLAASVAQAVRFRNVLVHGYAEVDDRLVVGFLRRLSDLSDYATAMSRLLHEE